MCQWLPNSYLQSWPSPKCQICYSIIHLTFLLVYSMDVSTHGLPDPLHLQFSTSELMTTPSVQDASAKNPRILLNQFGSVTQLHPILCDPMDCSTPGLPVYHHLPEFTQTHVHRVGDAIQPSHPLSSLSPPALNPSQHQSFLRSQLFAWSGQRIGVSASASVLPMNIQDWFPLRLTGWISLQSKGLSRVFSNTTVQKHQFFCAQPSSQSKSHIHTWLLEKP